MQAMRYVMAILAMGLAAASFAHADDFTVSPDAQDLPLTPGASATFSIAITNAADAAPTAFDIHLPLATAGSDYVLAIVSPDTCGPLVPDLPADPTTPTAATHVPTVAAGASATCVISVTRGANEIDSGILYGWAKRVDTEEVAYFYVRVGAFADVELDASVQSREVTSNGVHTIVRLSAHNASSIAVAPTVSMAYGTTRLIQHVVAGACELLTPESTNDTAFVLFLRFPAVTAGGSATCDLESTMTLSEHPSGHLVSAHAIADGVTGGTVLVSQPSLGYAEFPLAFATMARNQYGLSGSWANPATPAQGVVLNIVPGVYGDDHALLFGGWFTYGDGAGAGSAQHWYTLQGNVTGTGENDEPFTPVWPPYDRDSVIYESTGGFLDTDVPATTRRVGTATLRFADCNNGQLVYHFDVGDRQGVIPLNRLLPNVACDESNVEPLATDGYSLEGTWADPANGSQGLVVDVDPASRVLFAGWFTYVRARPGLSAQRWYTLQGLLRPGTAGGDGIAIFESEGGEFDGPAPATTVPVGDVDITLVDCTHATLAYRFTSGENSGITGTLDMARLGAPPASCAM